MTDLSKIKEIATQQELQLIETVLEAGKVLMEYWPGKQEPGKLDIQTKSDGSFVTEADYRSNEIIVPALEKLFPDDLICSEEIPFEKEDTSSDRVWYVDPLDGTSHFINAEDDFSILVGLCECQKPMVGIIYFPARDILGFASLGNGAIGDNKILGVSNTNEIISERIYLRNFDDPVPGFLTALDSGNAQYQVAEGTLDACIIKLRSHKAWDLVATSTLILESGGVICDAKGQEVSFNGEDVRSDYYVASNPLIKDKVLELIP